MMLRRLVSRRTATFALVVIILLKVFSAAAQPPLPEGSEDVPEEEPIELRSVPVAAMVILVSVVAAAWCLVRGSTIGASSMLEKPETSVWGLVLNSIGVLILFFGFTAALMIMVPEMLSLLALVAGEVLIAALILIPHSVGRMRATTPVEEIFPRVTTWTTVVVAIIISSILVSASGGGVDMIPESAWPLLLGAATMIGTGLCAAICIMVGVKSGSKAMVEKPELSIWSLLFVALGEGLAIYGLIVAILIIMAA